MRIVKYLLIWFCFIFSFYFFYTKKDILLNASHLLRQNHSVPKDKTILEIGEMIQTNSFLEDENLLLMMQENATNLVEKLGKPDRKDLSAYGYTWWIYSFTDQYFQFGVDEDGQIETIYVHEPVFWLEELKGKQEYEEIKQFFSFSDQVHYHQGLNTYTFYLSDDDLRKRPLVYLADDLFLQLYFDSFTRKLSSIRILKANTILQHLPYELRYRGKLPEKPTLTTEQWNEIERGMEQQIFELTNAIRSTFNLDPLKWHESLHKTAWKHSQNMKIDEFFSHQSPHGYGLKERLAKEEIIYQYAGENIAKKYLDAPAVMEGWLNSKGHREAILDDLFTHIGVGVFDLHFTQNFMTPLHLGE